MADSTLNVFLASVADAAELAALVPNPPTPAAGPEQGYFVLQRDTNAAYSWDSGTSAWVPVGGAGGGLPANVQGDIFYASGTNVVAALAKNASATRYLSNTGGSNNPAWAQVDLTNGVTGDLPFANLTQGSALSVLGVTGNSTADNASIAAGTDGFVLRRSGTSVAFGTLAAGAFPSTMAPLMVASTTLTNAQVLTLPTTPVTLVAAPGAGFRINLIKATLYARFTAGAYTGANVTASDLKITTANDNWLSILIMNESSSSTTRLTTFLDAGDNLVELMPYTEAFAGWVIPSAQAAIVDFDNDLIRLSVDNGGVDFGGGNAANTLTVKVLYTVEATS